MTLEAQKNNDEALINFNKALELYTQLFKGNDHIDLSYSLMFIGII